LGRREKPKSVKIRELGELEKPAEEMFVGHQSQVQLRPHRKGNGREKKGNRKRRGGMGNGEP